MTAYATRNHASHSSSRVPNVNDNTTDVNLRSISTRDAQGNVCVIINLNHHILEPFDNHHPQLLHSPTRHRICVTREPNSNKFYWQSLRTWREGPRSDPGVARAGPGSDPGVPQARPGRDTGVTRDGSGGTISAANKHRHLNKTPYAQPGNRLLPNCRIHTCGLALSARLDWH